MQNKQGIRTRESHVALGKANKIRGFYAFGGENKRNRYSSLLFYLLLNFTSALLQAERASQKSRERISTSRANEAGGEQMKKGVITMAKKKI